MASLVYLVPLFIFGFFPPAPHPTAQTMNWGTVIYGGVVLFAAIYYIIWARKSFIPPTNIFEDHVKDEYSAQTEIESGIQETVKGEKDLQKEVMHEIGDRKSDL
jgi:hypothetical protein